MFSVSVAEFYLKHNIIYHNILYQTTRNKEIIMNNKQFNAKDDVENQGGHHNTYKRNISPLSVHLSTSPATATMTANINHNQNVFTHLNYIFQFKDTELRHQYRYFNCEQESPMFASFLSAMFLGVIVLMAGIYIRDVHGANDNGNWLSIASALAMVSIFLLMVLGCFHVYYHYQYVNAKCIEGNGECPDEMKSSGLSSRDVGASVACGDDLNNTSYGTSRYYLQKKATISTFYCIMVQVFNICYTCRRAAGPICQYSHKGNSVNGDPLHPVFGTLMNYYYCGVTSGAEEEESSYMTLDCILLLFLGPITMAAVFSSLDIRMLWLQSVSSMSLFVGIVCYKGLVPSVATLVLWMIGTVFLIVDLQVARVKTFLMFLHLNALIEENDRLATEFHSSEMRFLIANVAHDLKTVSDICISFNN